MDKQKELLEDISGIKNLMERSSTFSSISGLSGIGAGIIGLVAFVISFIKISEYPDLYRITLAQKKELVMFLMVVAMLTLTAAGIVVVFFSYRKAKLKGLNIKDISGRKMTLNLIIPLATGGMFSLIILMQGVFDLIIPTTLIFYGLALVNAGKYTFEEMSWLGIIEIIIGLMAAVLTPYSLWLWGTGFGILNIIYGAIMYYKYER
ncbi:MAG TPA: hypothetical protein VHP32_04315 [Ignavibacteria bacterium]|nr:hypothetical protein [Ignavibacteria bacterium]